MITTETRDLRKMTVHELRDLRAEAGRRARRAWFSRRRRFNWDQISFAAAHELARRELASRPADAAPTSGQRAFLALLIAGTRTNRELSDKVDFDDAGTFAEITDAIARAWIETSGAIGGAWGRAPTFFALTRSGRAALGC